MKKTFPNVSLAICFVLEEPSLDPCYPIRAARGKNGEDHVLQSFTPSFYFSVSDLDRQATDVYVIETVSIPLTIDINKISQYRKQ